MSVPRVLLIPTHRTGVADAMAAAVAEILSVQGREVRYHHVGPLAPTSAWDGGEGSVFIDPTLTGEESAVGLYEAAVRHADISLLSSTVGLLDRREGVRWVPADIADLLDCPIVVLLDCRGWGTGIEVLATGIKSHLRSVDLAGAVLTGVTDSDHRDLLKKALSKEGIKVVGCLYEGQGLDWDSRPPGPWGLPLTQALLESVSRQVDLDGLMDLAGHRGFLAAHKRFSDHSDDGPVVMVAGGEGFSQWSRDSSEVLRAAGAQVRRLDLLADVSLPPETSGLIVAGTLWPDTIPDISMNTSLLQDISDRVGAGLPTLALGGGMLLMLSTLQDTLGRTSELAGIMPARGEILWDLDEPAYVEIATVHDNVLLAKNDKVKGWVTSEVELTGAERDWDPPLVLRGEGSAGQRRDTFGSDSLLCSPALIHLAATKEAAPRFVKSCRAFAASQEQGAGGVLSPEQ